jgi:hypothetical protein
MSRTNKKARGTASADMAETYLHLELDVRRNSPSPKPHDEELESAVHLAPAAASSPRETPVSSNSSLSPTHNAPPPPGDSNGGLSRKRDNEYNEEGNDTPPLAGPDVGSSLKRAGSEINDDQKNRLVKKSRTTATCDSTLSATDNEDASQDIDDPAICPPPIPAPDSNNEADQHLESQELHESQPSTNTEVRELTVAQVHEWIEGHPKESLHYNPKKAVDTAKNIYRGWNDLPRNERKEFTRGGRRMVGNIDVLVTLVLRGDKDPPPDDNMLIIAGPCGTFFQVKFSPGLLVCNKDPDALLYKLLTTKSHTTINTPYWRKRLEKDFVLMHLVPDHNNIRLPDCFSKLYWEGTSETYDYRSPCLMKIFGSYEYSRNAPYQRIGHLVGIRDHEYLAELLNERNFLGTSDNRELLRQHGHFDDASTWYVPPSYRNPGNGTISNPQRLPPQPKEVEKFFVPPRVKDRALLRYTRTHPVPEEMLQGLNQAQYDDARDEGEDDEL